MSQKNDDPVKVSCSYDVSPAIVFDAWVNRAVIPKWLFVGPSSEIVKVSTALRVSGYFSIIEYDRSDGLYIDHFGEYQQIDTPHQLVFTLSVPKHFAEQTVVSISIIATTSGCDLTLTQAGVPPGVTEKSWQEMLAKLKLLLEEN